MTGFSQVPHPEDFAAFPFGFGPLDALGTLEGSTSTVGVAGLLIDDPGVVGGSIWSALASSADYLAFWAASRVSSENLGSGAEG